MKILLVEMIVVVALFR